MRGRTNKKALFSVAAGLGLGVLSEALTRNSVDEVVYRRVAGMTPTSDHVAVFRRNEGPPLVKAFISVLRARARNKVRRPN